MEGDYIIAADGGYAQLASRGIEPDLVVGDFDSLGTVPEHLNIKRSPVEKDDTDMMIAVKHGLKLGIRAFIIDGGLGGRFDHTLANIQLLAYIANNGAYGVLLGRDICITVLRNGTISFSLCSGDEITRKAHECFIKDGGRAVHTYVSSAGPSHGNRISVFSVGDRAEGVTLTGLKYTLDNATISCDYPIGISNEFTGVPATITVRDGCLAVMWQGGRDLLDGELWRT